VIAYCDSQLVVKDFKKFELICIPRVENTTADALAAFALTSDPEVKRIIPVECISEQSIKEEKETLVITRSRAVAQNRGEPEIELPPVTGTGTTDIPRN